MKRILLLLAVLLGSIAMSAQPRSEEQAKQIASDFFKKKPATKETKIVVVPQTKVKANISKHMAKGKQPSATNNAFFVINDENNNRFMLVSADERMHEILGYSDNGVFDTENIPCGLLYMMDCYNREYEELLAGNIEPSSSPKKVYSQKIGPLIQTKWNQTTPYNDYCPVDPYGTSNNGYGGKCCTGCVATAMAQVMNFHKYPPSGHGSVDYNTKRYNIRQSMDFSNVAFDWNNMTNTYSSASTAAQKKAVATLMHTCGVASLMDYGGPNAHDYNEDFYNGSGAYTIDMAYALINYFGFNHNLKYYEKKYFSEEEWENIIIDNLNQNMPIMYAGDNGQGGGHAFLLTGYEGNGYFQFNWGWGGQYDGPFPLTSLKPGTNHNYSLGQEMVCYITKESFSEYEDGVFASEFILNNTNNNNSVYCGFSNLKWINAKVNSCNWSRYYETSVYKGRICVGLFDLNFNLIKELSNKSMNWDGGTYYRSFQLPSFQYDKNIFYDGSQYYIAPYSSSEEQDISFIRTLNGTTNYYLAKVENGKISFIPRGVPEFAAHKPLEGNYICSSLNPSNDVFEWNVALSRDGLDTLKYWFSNIDPMVIENGCKNSENRIYGILDKSGNIKIPTNQSLGEKCMINNFSSVDSIKVYVSTKDSIMTIEDVWGLVSFNENGSRNTLSQWSSTTFRFTAPDDGKVETPIIVVDNKERMTISCPTIGADIYYTYTQEGATPSASSTYYNAPIQLSENGIIKAIAIKGGKISDIATEEVDAFVVATPVIKAPYQDYRISITCTTENATIYYTTDGTPPIVSDKLKYSSEFTCDTSTVIKAFATRNNWKESNVVEYTYIVNPNPDIVIFNNTAGSLPSNISATKKFSITSLTVSGDLNGTDIKYIREMIQAGKLAYLDLKNANIVSGGEAYCYTGFSNTPHYTIDNVVGQYMFSDNNTLLSLELPNSAIRFEGLHASYKLKLLAIPESCEYVGFISGCHNLEAINLSKSVQEISGVGSECPAFSRFNVDESNPFIKDIDGVLFTKDGSTLLLYPTGGKDSYTIPNETKAIAPKAFMYAKVKHVNIPNSVLTIGEGAFSNSQLVEIEIPNSITEIEEETFYDCEELESVILPNSITTIKTSNVGTGGGPFRYCKKLKDINLPDKITNIGRGTFWECRSLSSIYIGKNIVEIASDAFNRCSSLQRFEVDEQNNSFCSDNGVLFTKDKSILIRYPEAGFADVYNAPNGVVEIADNAFESCENIKEVILPKSLRIIGDHSFQFCKFKNIILPPSLEVIKDDAFQACSELTSVSIPEGITSISPRAFFSCMKMNYLHLHSRIREIGGHAFAQCGLSVIDSNIENPDNVKVSGAFYLIPDTCTWRVPYGCSTKYRNCSWWNPTWRIVEKAQDGDSNSDGEVSVSDIVEMVDYIMDKPSDSFLFETSDLNKDGEVDITDISLTVPLVMTADLSRIINRTITNDDQLIIKETEDNSLSLFLDNTTGYVASQFDVVTSPGQIIFDIRLKQERAAGHKLNYEQIGDSRYRVVIYSLLNDTYVDNTGNIVDIVLNHTKDNVKLENIQFVTQNREICSFNTKENTTGISEIRSEDYSNVYSLNGVLINKGDDMSKKRNKGIYIVNGKKSVVK